MAINLKTGQRMGREAILAELKGLSKVRIEAVDIDDHIARLKSESDRGVIILAATLIEDALVTALERIVKCPDRKTRDRIFGPEGPLGSFSRRIDFAVVLGILAKDKAQGLHTIRFVRNAAAHAHVEIDFSVSVIKQALGTMLRPDQADDLETWPRKNVRNYYLTLCGVYTDQIVGDAQSLKGFFRTVRAGDYTELPPMGALAPYA